MKTLTIQKHISQRQLLFPFSGLGERLHPGAINQNSTGDDITGGSMLAQCFQDIGCIQYNQISARPDDWLMILYVHRLCRIECNHVVESL